MISAARRWFKGPEDRYNEFWRWFVRHQDELLHFEADQERIFNKLQTELAKIDPELTFEFGPPDTVREFVLSAAGIKSSFPSVVSLAKAAPRLDRWKVIAFRPRRSPIHTVEFRGKTVSADDVEFSLLDNGTIAGLYLFFPGFSEEDMDMKQIGYLMLDEALGEYDVETRVGLIKMLPSEDLSAYDRYPLRQLPEMFDQLMLRLEGKAGRPN